MFYICAVENSYLKYIAKQGHGVVAEVHVRKGHFDVLCDARLSTVTVKSSMLLSSPTPTNRWVETEAPRSLVDLRYSVRLCNTQYFLDDTNTTHYKHNESHLNVCR